MKRWEAIIYFIIGVILVLGLMVLFQKLTVKADAHSVCCLCHNKNNPHEVCSDCNSYKEGHYSHLQSGFDYLGRCIVPTPTSMPKPTCTPTPTIEIKPTETPEPTLEPTPTATPSPEVTPGTPEPTPEVVRSSTTSENREMGVTYTPPVCNGVYAKPAIAVTGTRVDEDTVIFNWWASTDEHDSQVIRYGLTKDNLAYSVNDVPKGIGSYEVNGLNGSHWWYQIGTWRGECISWSEVVDP